MEVITDYIKLLEDDGRIDKDCKFCQEHIYSQLKIGRRLADIHAPNHKASRYCEKSLHL